MMAQLCPEASQVCILSDDTSLRTFATNRDIKLAEYQLKKCPIVDQYGSGLASEIIGVAASGCPFMINKTSSVFGEAGRYQGACINPRKAKIWRKKDGTLGIKE